jgi:hypothetical protein
MSLMTQWYVWSTCITDSDISRIAKNYNDIREIIHEIYPILFSLG